MYDLKCPFLKETIVTDWHTVGTTVTPCAWREEPLECIQAECMAWRSGNEYGLPHCQLIEHKATIF